MSYLTLANGIPDFSQAVFSLWFRVPRESVVAASRSLVDAGLPGFFMLQNILTLVTFGRPQVHRNYQPGAIDVAEYSFTPITYVPYMADQWTESVPYDVDPCFIGLACNQDGTFRVAVNLQLANSMALRSTLWKTTKMTFFRSDEAPGTGAPGDGTVFGGTAIAAIADASYVTNAQPEWFYVFTNDFFQPDTWHHLLLSFDVGGGVSIGHPFGSSGCQLWYAIDDVDYRGWTNLGPFRDSNDGLGDNTILTYNAYNQSTPIRSGPLYYENHPIAQSSGSLGSATIPTSGAPFGIPASLKYVDGIFRVEMAELQVFTGVTLNTGSKDNRRAFVDGDGKPVDPASAVNLLGKKPDILLHGNDNWQEGRNTGTLGVEIDPDGEETTLANGQFMPTAKIEKYTPEPALTETP